MEERKDLYKLADTIISQCPLKSDIGLCLGESCEGRPIYGFCLGSGPLRISIISGCHADEPVGSLLLTRLVKFLGSLESDHSLLTHYQWWIVPHINPDGQERNKGWQDVGDGIGLADVYDPALYFSHVKRELPGQDLEFGFPRSKDDPGVRPESRAVEEWWRNADGPFHIHATLHGIALAGGPWFLLEPEWLERVGHVKSCCAEETSNLGYVLHDVDRKGDKGFHRIAPGFCTRPSSMEMQDYFLTIGDEDTATLFRPNSMESIRSLGGDPLTLVSEMPLFITPGVGKVLGPPDPVAEKWKHLRAHWELLLRGGIPLSEEKRELISKEIRNSGLKPMPIIDQMRLQWRLVSAGIEQVIINNGT